MILDAQKTLAQVLFNEPKYIRYDLWSSELIEIRDLLTARDTSGKEKVAMASGPPGATVQKIFLLASGIF